ncbi:MAG: lipase LipE [Myxococcales bacterium]
MSPPATPRTCRVYEPSLVTSQATEEEPRAGGLDRAAIEAIWRAVEAAYRTGLYPAMALCLRRRGHVVLDRAIGHARGNDPGDALEVPKVPATPATLFNVFSASKMVMAMLVHLLSERGLVHLDDLIVRYIPAFGRHGKERTTIRHVLTHRAGIPSVPPGGVDVGLLSDPRATVELLCDARPVWVPGRRLAYHALTGGYVLAEIARAVTGVDARTLLRREILEPLRFDHFGYGVPAAEVGSVALNSFTGPPAGRLAGGLFRKALGVGFEEAVALSNHPSFLTGLVPSGNVIGTANEGSRFMELLLRRGALDGVRVFAERTIREALREQSYLEMDLTMALPVRYGMGFMLGGRILSPYGMGTRNAFGHLGFSNVVLWADPDRDISACLMTSGKPFLALGEVRWYGVMQTITRTCE